MQGFRASIPLIAVCAALIGAFASESTKIKPILAELRSHEPRYVEELKQLVAFPSISASSARLPDLLKAADWLAQRLTAAGLQNVKTLSNPEGPRPSVYGEFIADASLPTALIYGHYDVQPADPEAAWTSPPFSPQVRNGSLYGRGASDNKGGLLAAIQAVEGILKVQGNLPINVKFLLEGEEEVGSPHLEPFLEAHRDALACDFVLSSDGEQQSATQPTIPIGLRGAVALEVEVAALGVDVHSGTWGGAVQNPNRGLVQLLATMVDPTTNKVLIKGFYDKVRNVTAQDRDDLLAANFDDAELTAAVGAIEPFGEAGFSTLERIWLRPTLEIVGLGGGFAGEGIKTVIPAKAVAKLAARLVPDQDPNEILTLIEAHIEAHHPAACNVTLRELGFKAKPYITDRAGAVNAAVARVLREMTGAEPQYPRRGATIPALAAFQKHLGVETTPFAFALPGDGAHAPDEHYSLAQYATAREAYARVLLELGADAASGKLVKRKAGGADSERRSGHTEL